MKNKLLSSIIFCSFIFAVSQSYAVWPTFSNVEAEETNNYPLDFLNDPFQNFEVAGQTYRVSSDTNGFAMTAKNMMAAAMNIIIAPADEADEANDALATIAYDVNVAGNTLGQIEISKVDDIAVADAHTHVSTKAVAAASVSREANHVAKSYDRRAKHWQKKYLKKKKK
jgi:hypothetical protein